LFAVTGVSKTGYTGLDYVIYIPKNSSSTIIDYTFTINTQISPSAEIVIKNIDSGGSKHLNIAGPTVLGGIISSPLPGKISVDQDTGESTANGLEAVLNSIANNTAYTLPVAELDVLGGLKSSLAEGSLSIDPDTHEGIVNGYNNLKTALANLMDTSTIIEDLRSTVLSGGWLPSASLITPGIVTLSNSLGQDMTTAATPKIVDDLREQVDTYIKDLRTFVENLDISLSAQFNFFSTSLDNNYKLFITSIIDGSILPKASSSEPGTVKLSSEINQDETIAATPKAVDDLRQSFENSIAQIIERLETLEEK
jgi:hypothetical protein